MDTKELAHRAAGLAAAITEYFLVHNQGCTVAELALATSRSESWIRRVLAESHGVPRGCVVADGQREKFSKDYPSQSRGFQRVDIYQPTMTTLRDLVVKLRAERAAPFRRDGRAS